MKVKTLGREGIQPPGIVIQARRGSISISMTSSMKTPMISDSFSFAGHGGDGEAAESRERGTAEGRQAGRIEVETGESAIGVTDSEASRLSEITNAEVSEVRDADERATWTELCCTSSWEAVASSMDSEACSVLSVCITVASEAAMLSEARVVELSEAREAEEGASRMDAGSAVPPGTGLV